MDKNKDTKKVKKKIFGILIYKRILKNIHPKIDVQLKFSRPKAKKTFSFMLSINSKFNQLKEELIRAF
jgi:hypothetical protein